QGRHSPESAKSFVRRMPAPPLRTRLLQLRLPRVGSDACTRLTQAANLLAKLDQLLIGHEAQTFAQLLQLDFFGFESLRERSIPRRRRRYNRRLKTRISFNAR